MIVIKPFTVIVNPFTRVATITKEEYPTGEINEIEIQFNDLDEWYSFNIGDKIYDAHFLYDDEFSFNIYPVDENNHNDYKECLVEKLEIVYSIQTKRTWVDEGCEGKDRLVFTERRDILKHIKDILAQDDEMLKARGYTDVNKVSEDDLFEIAFNHYSIYEQ